MFSLYRKTLNFLPKKSFGTSIESNRHKYSIKYGRKLACMFATVLEKQKEMVIYQHQCYCGTGFRFSKDEKFHFCKVWDGWPTEDILTFDNRDIFIEWLASKNDLVMQGTVESDPDLYEEDKFYRGNQRVDRGHIEGFIKKYSNNVK